MTGSAERSSLGGMWPSELEHYSDGEWYDAEYVHIGGDIPYYVEAARSAGGPVLELACGTGRLSQPIALAKLDVLGIDIAPSMIERAEKKRLALPPEDRQRLRYQLADMRTVRVSETFAAVILAFNTLMHMKEDDDLAATFETVKTHLSPGGRFFLDLHTPHPGFLARDPNERYDPQQMIDPRSGQRYIVTENNEYDPRTQINTMRFYYQPVDRAGVVQSEEERMIELHMRVIFPRELDRWLEQFGFEILEDWDDFEKTRPFSATGGRRIMVARLRGAA